MMKNVKPALKNQRIIQEDVWNDTYDWFDDLIQNIIKITSEHTIQNIYMGKKNEYNNFK
jgi:hypothetical protein